MKALWFCSSLLSWLCFQTDHAGAHNIDELKALFEPTPIPQELMKATKELDATAGMKSIREEAHQNQHTLLEQYVQALADKQCRESLANISEIDRGIIEERDKGSTESEQKLRERRDDAAAFVGAKCTATSLDQSLKPQQ